MIVIYQYTSLYKVSTTSYITLFWSKNIVMCCDSILQCLSLPVDHASLYANFTPVHMPPNSLNIFSQIHWIPSDDYKIQRMQWHPWALHITSRIWEKRKEEGVYLWWSYTKQEGMLVCLWAKNLFPYYLATVPVIKCWRGKWVNYFTCSVKILNFDKR